MIFFFQDFLMSRKSKEQHWFEI